MFQTTILSFVLSPYRKNGSLGAQHIQILTLVDAEHGETLIVANLGKLLRTEQQVYQ